MGFHVAVLEFSSSVRIQFDSCFGFDSSDLMELAPGCRLVFILLLLKVN